MNHTDKRRSQNTMSTAEIIQENDYELPDYDAEEEIKEEQPHQYKDSTYEIISNVCLSKEIFF